MYGPWYFYAEFDHLQALAREHALRRRARRVGALPRRELAPAGKLARAVTPFAAGTLGGGAQGKGGRGFS